MMKLLILSFIAIATAIYTEESPIRTYLRKLEKEQDLINAQFIENPYEHLEIATTTTTATTYNNVFTLFIERMHP